MMLLPKLLPNWKKGWKWYSTQAHVAQVAIVGTWEALPEGMHAAIPATVVIVAVGVAGVAGLIGRMIDQEKPDVPAE
jgi:hypothetical protein